MEDVFVLQGPTQGLGARLKSKPFAMLDEEWVNMQAPALSMIRLHLFLVQVLSFDAPIKLWD